LVWCNSKPSCILHEVINHIVKYRTWQCHRTGFTDYTHSIATMNHTPIKPDKQWYLLCNIRNYSGNTQNTEQKGINHEMGMTRWKKEKWAGRSSIATSLLTVYIWISSKHWGWLDEKGRSEAEATDKEYVDLGLHSSVFWCGISWTQQVRKLLLCLLYILLIFFPNPTVHWSHKKNWHAFFYRTRRRAPYHYIKALFGTA